MEERQQELAELRSYVESIDKEVTMILQSLQWDQKHLLERKTKAVCEYDSNHTIPLDKKELHDKKCFLKSLGYGEDDRLLPEPIDPNANSLVRLSANDINRIINMAASADPTFKKGAGCRGPEPLTLARLQATYTADERRAIHDAVVAAVPSCHDLADLSLPSLPGEGQKADKPKSRLEILAELRDMKRRRVKYRVAAKTRNYSDVLRDVIKTQMELYTEVTDTTHQIPSKNGSTNQNPNIKITNQLQEDQLQANYKKPNDPHRSTHKDDFRNTHGHKRDTKERYNESTSGKRRYDEDRKEKDRHYKRARQEYESNRNSRCDVKPVVKEEDYYRKSYYKEDRDRHSRHTDKRHSYESNNDVRHREHDYNHRSDRNRHTYNRNDKYEASTSRNYKNIEQEERERSKRKKDRSKESEYRRYYDVIDIKQEKD